MIGPLKIFVDGPPAGFEEKKTELLKIVGVIPEDASVSTQPELLTLMSERREIWSDYDERADIILIFPFFQEANVFADDKSKIIQRYDLVTKNDTVYLFVKKNKPDLAEKIRKTLNA